MIIFISANYSEEKTTAAKKTYNLTISDFQVHARMFVLTNKYHIQELQIHSIAKYFSRFRNFSTAIEFLKSVKNVYTLTSTTVRSLQNK